MYNNISIPAIIAFAISVAMGPITIPFLYKLKVGQTIRDEGPESHLKKNGTATMGGVMFLTAFLIASLFFVKDNPHMIPVIILTMGFGVIGFLDDYIKVALKRSLGLRAWQKMGLQIILTGFFAFYLFRYTDISMAWKVPFLNGVVLDFGWFNIPLVFLVVLGTVNGTNFTDGLDGLASSVTAVVALFFMVAATSLNPQIVPVASAMIGALLGFLIFNSHKASVFMGDTGSLALGGFVSGCAYLMQLQLFIVIVGFIYFAEVLSVMIQVSYFKYTKKKYGEGKRIFKMAPLHHHFEMCGHKETKVVFAFTIVTIVLCLVGFLGLW